LSKGKSGRALGASKFGKEKWVKKIGTHCIDCGSAAVATIVDEVKPLFRMEIVDFACGAVLKSTFTANGNVVRATHSGCLTD
jgi:hypothetical protein